LTSKEIFNRIFPFHIFWDKHERHLGNALQMNRRNGRRLDGLGSSVSRYPFLAIEKKESQIQKRIVSFDEPHDVQIETCSALCFYLANSRHKTSIKKNTKTVAKEKRVFLFSTKNIKSIVWYVLRPNEIEVLYKKTINLTTVLRPQFLSSIPIRMTLRLLW
jgi:pyruvate formate-lyase activating enzyme-like uncharacterized protein